MSQIQPKDDKTTSQKTNSKDDSTSHEYQIRPSIGKSFPISAIREIINEVLLQVLDGMYILWMIHEIFFWSHCISTGKEYASTEVGNWCRLIVNDINRRIKELEIPRYKHIVQIMLSEQTGAGCR